MSITRRNFIKAAGATAALAALPGLVRGAATLPVPKNVLVVGGGFAGSTVAKYLRLWSGGQIAVTLVDPSPSHVSCVLSNLVLNGRMQLSELTIAHSKLGPYGVKIVQGQVTRINPASRSVTLQNGTTLTGDRLILAMGVGFGKVDGWTDQTKIPHAWIAGQQTTILRDQVRALPAGGTFVMTVPKAPYRCPPGPYERACLVADIMKRKGGGKVVVLDANSNIQAEAETFNRAFTGIYKGIVTYVPDATLLSVSLDSAGLRTVNTTRGTFKGGVANILPPHQAPDAVLTSGLVPAGQLWAPVDPLTYESTLASFPGVHVIGDSQATGQPKSGHMANSQAKVCADAIVRMSQGLNPLADPDRTANVTTNSACYSPITYSEASWLTANFAYDTKTKNMKLVQLGEAGQWNSGNYEDMMEWASNLFTDSFT